MVQDTFATAFVTEDEGGVIRLVFTADRRDAAGNRERVIVARIVLPKTAKLRTQPRPLVLMQ
jgi:hypothetical protein